MARKITDESEDAKRHTTGAENDSDPSGSIRIVNSHLNELARATRTSNNPRLNLPHIDTLHQATSALEQFKLKLPDESIANFTKAFAPTQSAIDALHRATAGLDQFKLKSPLDESIASFGKSIADEINRATTSLDQFKMKLPDKGITNTVPPKMEAGAHETSRSTIASPSDFGRLLRDTRKAMGMSQQQFADLAGVGRRFVSECEAGKPRLEFGKVLQVAKAAGIDVFAGRR